MIFTKSQIAEIQKQAAEEAKQELLGIYKNIILNKALGENKGSSSRKSRGKKVDYAKINDAVKGGMSHQEVAEKNSIGVATVYRAVAACKKKPEAQPIVEKPKEQSIQSNEDLRWVAIPTFEGIYELSNYGTLRSLDRETSNGRGGVRKYKGKPLKRMVTEEGFGHSLSKSGVQNLVSLSKLMVAVFMNDVDHERPYKVRHKDGSNSNFHLDNLEIEYI